MKERFLLPVQESGTTQPESFQNSVAPQLPQSTLSSYFGITLLVVVTLFSGQHCMLGGWGSKTLVILVPTSWKEKETLQDPEIWGR